MEKSVTRPAVLTAVMMVIVSMIIALTVCLPQSAWAEKKPGDAINQVQEGENVEDGDGENVEDGDGENVEGGDGENVGGDGQNVGGDGENVGGDGENVGGDGQNVGGDGQNGDGQNGDGQNGDGQNGQNGGGQNGDGNGQNGDGQNGDGQNGDGNGQNGDGQNGDGQNGDGQNGEVAQVSVSQSESTTKLGTNAAGLQLTETQKPAATGDNQSSQKPNTSTPKTTTNQQVQPSTPNKTTTKTPAKTAAAQQLVANGTYLIESVKNVNVVLDMSGMSKKPGGNAIVWNYNGGKNQLWTITCVDAAKNVYTIKNALSGLMLDVYGGKANNGTNVLQWSAKKTNNANQKWVITKQGNQYKIASYQNQNYVLDVSGARAKSGDNVLVWKSKASDNGNQRWYLIPTNVNIAASNPAVTKSTATLKGIYTIARADAKHMLLDIEGTSQINGANADLWSNNAGMNQKWAIYDNGKGFYTIMSVNSGKVLDISGASMAANANVLQWSPKSSGNDNQLWSIIQKNGYYNIVSKKSGMALDAAGNGKKNGTNMHTWLYTNSAAQRFAITPVQHIIADDVYSIGMRVNVYQVIDVPANSSKNNEQLELWGNNKGYNQKIQVAYQGMDAKGNGIYTLQLANSGKFVANQNGKVVQQSKSNSDAQRWIAAWQGNGIVLINKATGKPLHVDNAVKQGNKLTDSADSGAPLKRVVFLKQNLIENGVYHVNSLMSGSGRILDVTGNSKANGAKLELWANNNGKNQKFKIAKVGSYYRITASSSDKAVMSNAAGTVYQSTYTGAKSQLWKAVISPNGGFVFVNAQTGKAMNVNGAKANGTNVNAVAENDYSANQRWSLSKTYLLKDYQEKAYNKAVSWGSKTNYFLAIDYGLHRLMVFQRENKYSDWNLVDEWRVSTGRRVNGVTATPQGGTFIRGGRDLAYGTEPYYTAYYWTPFKGGAYFHSILYHTDSYRVLDGTLGEDVSVSCIRNPLEKARWIFYNCADGTGAYGYY